MIRIGVGEVFPLDIHEGASVYSDETGFLFMVKFPNLSIQEVVAFRTNPIKINLCKVDEQLAFFNLNIKDSFDGDIAFTINQTSCGLKGLVAGDNLYTNIFTFALIEGTNSKVAALRTIGVSQEFSKKIYEVCKEQEAYGLRNYNFSVTAIQQKYSSDELLKNFSVCEYISKNQ